MVVVPSFVDFKEISMIGSYLRVAALVCLAAAVGCSDDGNPGGSGGTAGTGGGAGGDGGSGGAAGEGGGGGSGGAAGQGGEGGSGGGGTPIEKSITLGCSNNVTDDISILAWDLSVTPDGDVVADGAFDAELTGVAFFDETFLDAAQGAIPGGITEAALVSIAATVHVQSGATGDDVLLVDGLDVPYTCAIPPNPECDPANDTASVPGARGNTDCVPTGLFNPCNRNVSIPTSDDCEVGGVCDGLGKTGEGSQCETNGFCVTGPLPLPMNTASGSYTADATGSVLFGWDDENTGATVNPDGTYALPPAVFANSPEPNGLRVSAGLGIALQCTMAVDSGGDDGVDVPDQASPTPDSALLEIPITE